MTDKPMSNLMYALVNYVRTYEVQVTHLRWAKDITLWACGKRGYLKIILPPNGEPEEATVELTNEGKIALNKYLEASNKPYMPGRDKEADISRRSQAVLGYGKILSMKKQQPKAG